MQLVLRSLTLVLAATLATAGPLASQDSQGGGGSSITFDENMWRGGGNFQAGETSATSVQSSTGGEGQQTNQGSAQAASLQREQTGGPGGNVQEISNQAVIQALQQANGTAGGAEQISNNQININSSQLQQNVNGTLVNVQTGLEGVVIINADDLAGPGESDAELEVSGDALFFIEEQDGLTNASQITSNQGVIQTLQELTGNGTGDGQQASNTQVNVQATQEQENANGTFVHVQEGHQGVVIINTNDESGAIVEQTVINDRPLGEVTDDSATCRYFCFRRIERTFYCCDFGNNQDLGTSDYHDGECPEMPELCENDETTSYTKCAFDSQCTEEEVCCYNGCARHHVCQVPFL
ncbi:uncharacterized protein LOC122368721 [Amphibalanus amphitrite]|uniref:uncharacterized protein LOC122368721 n=1 Tax=Amphibalanus amphitrite TaxID=1232801 RepID=UPI001C9076A7|nr:uncharacterized protein LOC122368721 [Amphibalanus amphitrite]